MSVTIPMEGIKHRPDDGLSASKRDEDLPTIQEECPSCSNDLACAQPPSSPPAPARKCSPEAPQILPHHAAALRRRGADHLLHVYRVRLEMEARLLDSSDEHILRGGLSTLLRFPSCYLIALPSQRTSHLIGLRVFGGTEGSAA